MGPQKAVAMSSAKIKDDGEISTLDGKAAPDEIVTSEDAKDPEKVARILGKLLREVAELRRRWNPQRIDFEDITVTNAGDSYSFEHGFKGRVRWWPVGWRSGTADACVLVENETLTTDTTLVLDSYGDGIVCVRVEEAG